MTMFLGKISRERRTAPKRISTPLPPNIIRKGKKHYRRNDQGEEKEIKTTSVDFEIFFDLEATEEVA